MKTLHVLAAATIAIGFAASARADINVGVIVSTTGPGASLGIPEQNSVKLWPTEIAGQKIVLTILNDESDTTVAARNATRLISESKVDVIVGPSLTPTSLSALELVGQSGTPMISLAGGGAFINPPDGPRRWAFRMAPPESIAVGVVLENMVMQGVKKVGIVALATSFGDGYTKTLEQLAPGKGIRVVGIERYNQNDTSVTAQVLRVLAAQPDAIYIMSSGTPGALPQIELAQRGFKGPVYQTRSSVPPHGRRSSG